MQEWRGESRRWASPAPSDELLSSIRSSPFGDGAGPRKATERKGRHRRVESNGKETKRRSRPVLCVASGHLSVALGAAVFAGEPASCVFLSLLHLGRDCVDAFVESGCVSEGQLVAAAGDVPGT